MIAGKQSDMERKDYLCDEALVPCLDALRTRKDAVLLVPTETVYGLVCDFSSEAGREKIYALKKRPKNKQLAAFMPNLKAVEPFVPEIPCTAEKIARAFCPGPVTLVIPGADGSTFGFRIPDHPFLLSLLKAYGKPLASTSANLSGTPAALSVEEAVSSLAGSPDVIVNGGKIPTGSQASTVIQIFADESWKILRMGPVTEIEIRDVVG